MINVKVTYGFAMPDIIRQTPGSQGIWGNCKFFVNQNIDECDFWIVYGRLLKIEKTVCPEENVIFMSGEPSSTTTYNEKFLKQFNTVVTCNRELKHFNKIYTQPTLPWHFGHYINKYDYNELKDMTCPPKTRLISAITSNKVVTPGHRKRLDFIMNLKEYFKDKLDIFGRGINFVEDKSSAILDYKYHIVVENSSFEHYWSEKLADSYLGYSYPVYFGCPNINDYFSKNALTKIDINNLKSSIEIIEDVTGSGCFDYCSKDVRKARSQVLDEYNFFPWFHNFCNKSSKSGKKIRIILKPEKIYTGNMSKRIGIYKRSIKDFFSG
jgi:hypothetical protein